MSTEKTSNHIPREGLTNFLAIFSHTTCFSNCQENKINSLKLFPWTSPREHYHINDIIFQKERKKEDLWQVVSYMEKEGTREDKGAISRTINYIK